MFLSHPQAAALQARSLHTFGVQAEQLQPACWHILASPVQAAGTKGPKQLPMPSPYLPEILGIVYPAGPDIEYGIRSPIPYHREVQAYHSLYPALYYPLVAPSMEV